MGFFSKKPKTSKVYSLSQAIEIVGQNPGYTPVEEGTGYIIVPDEQVKQKIEEHKKYGNDFISRINGNGTYSEYGSIPTHKNYNNYQTRNTKQVSNNWER